jgi:hypothetical protein
MQARILTIIALCATVFLLAPAQACQNCGGKSGVPFARIHSSHDTGQIILFARPDSQLRSFNRRAELGFRLERSGHTVRLISNDRDLEEAIRANRTALVLAEPTDAVALRARLAGDAAAPVVVSLQPVAVPVPQDEATEAICHLTATVDQGRTVVRTIDWLVDSRARGCGEE